MKTPATPANLAIKALAESIVADVAFMHRDAVDAVDAAQVGDMDLTVGCLLPVQAKLEALQAQLAAILALHRK